MPATTNILASYREATLMLYSFQESNDATGHATYFYQNVLKQF